MRRLKALAILLVALTVCANGSAQVSASDGTDDIEKVAAADADDEPPRTRLLS